MAKIVKSDSAPAGPIEVVFGHDVVKVIDRKGHDTDNYDVLAAAEKHPWLSVKDSDETPTDTNNDNGEQG